MRHSKGMIFFYIIICFLSFAIALLCNINIEIKFFVINSPIISNNLIMSIAIGIFTAVIVALAIEFLQYRNLKESTMKNLYANAANMYGELKVVEQILQCGKIENIISLSNLISANLIERFKYYLLQIKLCDYSPIWLFEKTYKEYNKFLLNYNFIWIAIDDLRIISISVLQQKINDLQKINRDILSQIIHKQYKTVNRVLVYLSDFCNQFYLINNKKYNWLDDKQNMDSYASKVCSFNSINNYLNR